MPQLCTKKVYLHMRVDTDCAVELCRAQVTARRTRRAAQRQRAAGWKGSQAGCDSGGCPHCKVRMW